MIWATTIFRYLKWVLENLFFAIIVGGFVLEKNNFQNKKCLFFFIGFLLKIIYFQNLNFLFFYFFMIYYKFFIK